MATVEVSDSRFVEDSAGESARRKYLISAGCGALACGATVVLLHGAGVAAFISLAAGLLAMIFVTLFFFARQVRVREKYLVLRDPYWEFAYVSMAEFAAGWSFAVSTRAVLWVQVLVGIVIVLAVRYAVRKVFLHDLCGIHGTPRERAKPPVALAIKMPPRAASA